MIKTIWSWTITNTMYREPEHVKMGTVTTRYQLKSIGGGCLELREDLDYDFEEFPNEMGSVNLTKDAAYQLYLVLKQRYEDDGGQEKAEWEKGTEEAK